MTELRIGARIAVLVVIFLLSTWIVAQHVGGASATTPAFNLDIVTLERIGGPPAPVVFLGDSITYGWSETAAWREVFEPMGARVFGFPGDATQHLLWRLDHGDLRGLRPKLIVLLIGTNNTGNSRHAPAETVRGVRAVLARIHDACPDTTVLLLALLPRGESASDPIRVANGKVNVALAELEGVVFADHGDVFVDDRGRIRSDRMPDRLHPNEAGYRAWAEAMAPRIQALLAD